MNDAPKILKGRYEEDSPKVKVSCPSCFDPKVPTLPCLEYNTKYSRKP